LKFNFPALQVALDVTDGKMAEDLALKCWVDDHVWIEAGTPLIKSVGVSVIGRLRRLLPDAVIFADMKCIDAGFVEAELASISGANLMSVLGIANDATILEAIKACRRYGTGVVVDLISTSNPLKRAFEVQELGIDIVCFHTGIDVQKYMGVSAYESFIDYISKACKSLNIPVAVAGGITLDKVRPLIDAGVKIIVVGSAITKSSDPRETTIKFVNEILR